MEIGSDLDGRRDNPKREVHPADERRDGFFFRDFGINAELIDKPLPVARNRFLAEVVRQVAKYESRARVKGIRWIADEASDGELKPIISVEL